MLTDQGFRSAIVRVHRKGIERMSTTKCPPFGKVNCEHRYCFFFLAQTFALGTQRLHGLGLTGPTIFVPLNSVTDRMD